MTGIDRVIGGWPAPAREAARSTIAQYGPPDEVMPSRIAWRGVGPWKRVAVNRGPVQHRFPRRHHDLVEGWIDYRVPPERASDLAAFDGSIRVERTRGEIAARGDREPMNFLALNLAHELVCGSVEVDEARRQYTVKAVKLLLGRADPYTSGLRFDPPTGGTADPDHPVTAEPDRHP